MRSLRELLYEARGVEEEYTGSGIMVALWPSASLARRLAALAKSLSPESAESAEEMHLTLAVFGDKNNYDEGKLTAMRRVVSRMAFEEGPLYGKIAGMGRFSASKTSDGKDVLWVSPDLPKLPSFRQRVVEELGRVGVHADTTHGYTPHMTLAYIDSAAKKELPHFEPIEVKFDRLTLSIGSDKTHYPMR